RISMLVILLNCVTLGMYQPCHDEQCTQARCQMLAGFDHAVFAFFAWEMCVKVMAMGFWGRLGYIGDSWNRLDCFIVIAGTVDFLPQTKDLSLTAIRTVRVLRPLRAINRIPSMRILVMLLLDTLPMLGNVLLLCFFVFFIFGIVGVQLWKGLLRQRCYLAMNSTHLSHPGINLTDFYRLNISVDNPVAAKDFICASESSNGIQTCSNINPTVLWLDGGSYITCNESAQPFSDNLPTNTSCVNWNQYYTRCQSGVENPHRGAINFDNIGFAWVAIFQVISLESWVDIMYYVQDAHSFWDWIYFVLLIVIGSFFMINLCLVVIATQFSETKKREVEKMLQERRRRLSRSSLDSGASPEPASCYGQLVRLLLHHCRRGQRRFSDWMEARRQSRAAGRTGDPRSGRQWLQHQPRAPRASPEVSEPLDTFSPASRRPSPSVGSEDRLQQLAASASLVDCDSRRSSAWGVLHQLDTGFEEGYSVLAGAVSFDRAPRTPGLLTPTMSRRLATTESSKDAESSRGIFQKLRYVVKRIIDHKVFQQGILLAILFNTISMGIEYYDQPILLTDIIEYSNVVFCVIFGLEMLLKLIGDGLIVYISSGFNVFDASIVLLSIFELIQGGNSGLSVLRTFRLLRILKLVRFLPALRQQLFVMLKTMDNVATFFALLVLFIFIFSILGMTLFGGKFCWHPDGKTCTCSERAKPNSDCTCDRANFDTIMWSLVTVFQVLTQEDWNTVLYNGMYRTSPWAALYFIALMTFGNYVLFNLLVAILVEGFSSERKYYIMEKYRLKKKAAAPVKGSDIDNSKDLSGAALADAPDSEFASQRRKRKRRKAKESGRVGRSNGSKIVGDSTLEAAPQLTLPPPPVIIRTAATPERVSASSTAAAAAAAAAAVVASAGQANPKLAFHCSSSSIATIDRSVTPDCRSNSVGCESVGAGSPKSSTSTRPMMEQLSIQARYDAAQDMSGCNGQLVARHQSNGSNGRGPFLRSSPIENQADELGMRNLDNNKDDEDGAGSFSSNRSQLGSRRACEGSAGRPVERESGAEEERDSNASTEDDLQLKWLSEYVVPTTGCFKDREDYALYLFSPTNRFRLLCNKITQQRWFDYTVLFFIALNCITLAMERPSIPQNSTERQFLSLSNNIFTVIFTVEMLIKLVSHGLIISRHSYLRSGWNIMDGALVFISLIDILVVLLFGSTNRIFGILRVFRLLRTLRPLRVISRAPGLKLVVQTLLSSLRPIGNIVLICCTFFIIFGILGVQLFKGKFFYCKGPDLTGVTNKTNCLADKRNTWERHKYNFDNLGQALMALFVLSSRDGWVQIMYTGLDAVGENQQPKENNNEWLLLYFISFLLLVGFFVLNMFVGVVVENFHKCRASQEKEEKARRAAKRARRMEKKRRRIREIPYWSKYSRTRRTVHRFVESKYFDLIIATIIGVNVITMAMEFYMMPPEFEMGLKITNYAFSTVFVFEAIFKIFALGLQRYLKDKWNQLDVIIVALSIAGIILEEVQYTLIPINPTIIRVMRVLRIARVLKLLKMAKGIRALLDTVIQALPQVGNLGLLFFLLFFIFAALGVELFGRLECSLDNPCVGLSRHAHFENFGMAFLTLFRIATGDNWNGIMKDTLREKCDPSDNCVKNCCVSPIIAPIYFVVFVLMAQFVLVNVVVAVLMKHLEESHKMMSDDDELEKEIRRELEEEQREQQRQREIQERRVHEVKRPQHRERRLLVFVATRKRQQCAHWSPMTSISPWLWKLLLRLQVAQLVAEKSANH
uniref:Ion_trans domain-containing protein n=1 Tax=Macrostomum lignano TaxID=282301 RepID=A0A1I8G4E0_9PLAT